MMEFDKEFYFGKYNFGIGSTGNLITLCLSHR